jgi:hypothetical protein
MADYPQIQHWKQKAIGDEMTQELNIRSLTGPYTVEVLVQDFDGDSVVTVKKTELKPEEDMNVLIWDTRQVLIREVGEE